MIALVAIGSLARGPLRFQPKDGTPPRSSDALDGQIISNNGVTRGIVSMAGNGTGTQRVLVRADLLIDPRQVISTVFQMEYLPSGTLCRGTVDQVHAASFEATCRMPDGSKGT